jgi:hypothetical protein
MLVGFGLKALGDACRNADDVLASASIDTSRQSHRVLAHPLLSAGTAF